MKKRKYIIIFVLVLIIFVGYANKERIESYFHINDFSVDFWIKIDSQDLGEKYLTIKDKNQSIDLIAHLQDDEYNDKGIVLSHNNGEIYGGNDFLPEYGTYSYVAIVYERNTFRLYLNGQIVGERKFSKYFDGNNIAVDYLTNSIDNPNNYSYALSENEIIDHYSNNKKMTLDNINFNEEFKNNAYGKVSLPLTRKKIIYESSDINYLTVDDKYIYFAKNNSNEDVSVKLICKYEDVIKEISFIVRADNEDNDNYNFIKRLDNMFSSYISESDLFPTHYNGEEIKYVIHTDNILFSKGHFIDKLDREKVDLSLTIEFGDSKIEKNTNLYNEWGGYLISYFTGQAFWPEYVTGTETLCFAISNDLKTFNKLKINEITCMNGSNRFRDPFIFRNDDSFYILSTQAYYSPDIYLTKTKDFENFDTSVENISSYSYDINLGGNYSWAPEAYYDNKNNQYVIIYSDSELDDSCIYAVTTKDFKSYSSPYVFFNAGYKIIDATMYLINGKYYLFYKDERPESRRICYAAANDISGITTWVMYDDIQCFATDMPSEGPCLIKNYLNNKYYLYADLYGLRGVYSTVFTESNYNDEYLLLDNNISQFDDIRHFSILPLTKKEYNSLEKYTDISK